VVSRSLRLGVIASFATIVVVATAVAQLSPGTPLAIGSPTPEPVPSTRVSEAPTARPAATCRVLPTPDYGPQVPHAQVNGEPSLGVPTLRGVILVEIRQCREIAAVLQKYGLAGPATRYIDVLESDEMIANGATRWYRIAVTPGTESATVVELYRHPEDIEYVQLLPEFTGGAAG
jgi:hypothetical protein